MNLVSETESLRHGGLYVGIVDKARKVTAACGMIHTASYNGDIPLISGVYTSDGYRRMGLCTQVMQTLIQVARDLGYERVRLYATWEGAQVYRKLGFRLSDRDAADGADLDCEESDWQSAEMYLEVAS